MKTKMTTLFIVVSIMAVAFSACGAAIFTANGRQNMSEKKRKELYRFGKNI